MKNTSTTIDHSWLAMPLKTLVLAMGLHIALASSTAQAQSFNPDPNQRWQTWQNAGAATVRTPQLRDGNVYKLTPAEIIYYAALENNVSPLLLLVKMQQEASLISTVYTDPAEFQKKLDRATGYGVMDRAPTESKWFGFYPQLVAAAYQFGVVWKGSFQSSSQAIARYSTDPNANRLVSDIYRMYAARMNEIAGTRYLLDPPGTGHIDDFKNISAAHIQKFLEEFPGGLKNKALFNGKAPATTGTQIAGQTPMQPPMPTTGNLFLNKPVSVSAALAGGTPGAVVDGKPESAAVIGGFSGAFDIDLGALVTLSRMELTPMQNPQGQTVHALLVSRDGVSWTEVARLQGQTSNGVRIVHAFTQPLAEVRKVRVQTLSSPSWVGWMEIAGYGTAGTSVANPLPVTNPPAVNPSAVNPVQLNPSVSPLLTQIGVNPATVQAGQPMTFMANLNNAQGVAKVELVLPDANVVEPMTQTASAQWTRSRTMQSPGVNRPFQVRVTATNGQVSQQAGAYTVVAGTIQQVSDGAVSIAQPLSPMPSFSQSFGNKLNYKTSACHFIGHHTGVDYAPVIFDQPVFSIADGTVTKVGQIGHTPNSLGNYVVVDHPQLGVRSYYLHINPAVVAGVKVKAGQKIASIANTKDVGKHLHLEIQKNDFSVVDSNGKPKLFVGHSTTPIGSCGYLSRESDLNKGWINPAEFLKHPTFQAGTSPHQSSHEDIEEEDFPVASDQRRRLDVISQFLSAISARTENKFSGTVDTQANTAGLITTEYLLRPQENSSRMEVALWAYRSLKKYAPSSLAAASPIFPLEEFGNNGDATALEYQYVVNSLAASGIVNGTRDGGGELRFFPTRKSSSSEIQAIIDRVSSKLTPMNATGTTIVSTSNIPQAASITGISAIPVAVQIGQQMTFAANLSSVQGVTKVDLVFPDANVTEPMSQSSPTQWARTRTMQTAGVNRPFQIRVTLSNGLSLTQSGAYTIQSANPTQPNSPNPPNTAGGLSLAYISANPASVAAGQQMTFSANLNSAQGVAKVELVFPDANVTEQMGQSGPTQWARSRTMQSPGVNRPFQVRVTATNGQVSQQAGAYTVTAAGAQNPVTGTPVPVAALTPALVKNDSVVAGTAWQVGLTTNVPVATAELVFPSGRRIMFQGGPTQWKSDNSGTTIFGDVGSQDYTLRIQRQANGAFEEFPGGRLSVSPRPVTPINATLVSPTTGIQGQGYTLQVRLDAPADRVTSQWPDLAEGSMIAVDASRTLWKMNRVFDALQPMPFTVRVYKDGVTQPVSQLPGSVAVMAATATIKLADVSRSILVGESPAFTAIASLPVKRVTVALGNEAPAEMPLVSSGGPESIFKGSVPARAAGMNVPYVLTGYDAQGKVITSANGTVSVTAAGDALRVPNPIPATGVAQGDHVVWNFVTNRQPDQMWMEFPAPVGNVALEGYYLKLHVNYPAGNYPYRLMRKDSLGNVYPIQGAGGTLTVKSQVVVPTINQLVINGTNVTPGSTVQVSLRGQITVQAVAPGAKGLVFMADIPPFGSVSLFGFTSQNGNNWQSTGLNAPTLSDAMRGMAQPGNYPAKVYWGTGNADLTTNLGGTVNFVLQLVP